MNEHTPAPKALDLPGMYPDLFVGLTSGQVHNIEQVFAASWHEGWEPNRDDVAGHTAWVRGDISEDELRAKNGLPPATRHRSRLSTAEAMAVADGALGAEGLAVTDPHINELRRQALDREITRDEYVRLCEAHIDARTDGLRRNE